MTRIKMAVSSGIHEYRASYPVASFDEAALRRCFFHNQCWRCTFAITIKVMNQRMSEKISVKSLTTYSIVTDRVYCNE